MKGNYRHFDGYNSAGSSFVGIVRTKAYFEKSSDLSTKGTPNSVSIVKSGNKVLKERYYDSNGDVYLDIDYTNHGNSKTHPIVPHQHKWTKDDNGNLKHCKGEKIK